MPAFEVGPAGRGRGQLQPADRPEAGTPPTDRADYLATVYRANSVMVLLGLVWNTGPGACAVEPPVRRSAFARPGRAALLHGQSL